MNTHTNAATKPAAAPARALPNLAAIVRRTKPSDALRVLLYGVEGIGKTTFAADAPAPVFIGKEDGYGLLEVNALPEPHTWAEVLAYVRALAAGGHEYKTLVLDTVDWLEPLVFAHVCANAKPKVDSIEEVGGGYGKGYVAALDEWRILLVELDRCRARGMNVILLAHAHCRPFKNPEGPDYDRFTLKVNEKAAGLLKEWCDAVLFARYEDDVTTKRRNDTKGKATGGARVIRTARAPAYDAKNRHNLPDPLEMSWQSFAEAAFPKPDENAARCAALRAEIERMRDSLAVEQVTSAVNQRLAKYPTDAAKLAELKNTLAAKLAAHAPAETPADARGGE